MNSKIYIVIPVYNRLAFTKKCLRSIFNQTYTNFKVILIDDGSTDKTAEFIQKNYPNVKIIRGDGNWWWTKSMYKGVKFALKSARSSDFILEMNNDLYFGKNYFQNLINTAKKNKRSLIGSICITSDKIKKVVEAGIRIDWPTGLVYGVAQTVSNKLSYYKNMDVVDDLDALPGKGTLIPVEVFKSGVNFKYKLLPHYIADYEFAANAKKHGFKLLVATKAVAMHYWEATGISGKPSEKIKSYKRVYDLLFGRKSMNNIIDWIRFINLVCPDELKLRNYYFTSLKLLKALFSVFPFYYLLPIFPILGKVYNGTKLILYRIYLKIVQYPEYHLKKK